MLIIENRGGGRLKQAKYQVCNLINKYFMKGKGVGSNIKRSLKAIVGLGAWCLEVELG